MSDHHKTHVASGSGSGGGSSSGAAASALTPNIPGPLQPRQQQRQPHPPPPRLPDEDTELLRAFRTAQKSSPISFKDSAPPGQSRQASVRNTSNLLSSLFPTSASDKPSTTVTTAAHQQHRGGGKELQHPSNQDHIASSGIGPPADSPPDHGSDDNGAPTSTAARGRRRAISKPQKHHRPLDADNDNDNDDDLHLRRSSISTASSHSSGFTVDQVQTARTSTTSTTTTTRSSSKPRQPPPGQRTRLIVPKSLNKFTASELKDVAMIPENEAGGTKPAYNTTSGTNNYKLNPSSSFSRSESVSSASVALSSRTVTSTNPSATSDTAATPHKPFVQRNGRTYLNDASSSYPLPCDLPELHRQSMLTLLLVQVFGAPVCCPSLAAKPPLRVLELGCGTGFWSMLCHRYFKSRGHGNVSFTGLDVAPLAVDESSPLRPDKDMKWNFVRHDMRNLPLPFDDNVFDLVFSKDLILASNNSVGPAIMEECIRVLNPGGTLELWETDHVVRMLRPHVPSASVTGSDVEEQEAASSLGAYIINANTPLSAPLNTYLVEYNQWVSKAAESRNLVLCPCTLIGPSMLQESDTLTDMRQRRLAIPFGDVRWEREGVGGVVNKGGKSYVKMSDSGDRGPHHKVEKKTLTVGQAAIRRTALQCLVQEIQSWEPLLREASGKSQDEWDLWFSKMTADLMNEAGTSWGECLEAGAWWARKK